MVGGVVEPQRLGQMGGLGELGAGLVGQDIGVKVGVDVGEAGAHQPFERLPVGCGGHREAVGAAQQDRVGAPAVLLGDVVHRRDGDRGQVVVVVRIGEPVDVGLPPGGRQGDAQMVEHRTAADHGFAAGPVGQYISRDRSRNR